MSEVIKNDDLKNVVETIFSRMDEVGATVHPWVVEDFLTLARLAGVSEDRIPTELRALLRNE